MIKNNKLIDLFVRGQELKIVDPEREVEVDVWLQKLNPTQHEAIVRRANAARAKMLAMKNDPDSDEYQSTYGEVLDMEKEDMINLIIAEEMGNKINAIESEISERDEWANDNYLQGLRDAWQEELSDKYFRDKDEEAAKVYEELKRFTEQVAKEAEAERQSLIADHLERNLEAVARDATKAKIDAMANIEWLKVFRKGQLVYGVRDAKNHSEQLLDWQAVDLLQEEVFNQLSEGYRMLSVDPIEGKD